MSTMRCTPDPELGREALAEPLLAVFVEDLLSDFIEPPAEAALWAKPSWSRAESSRPRRCSDEPGAGRLPAGDTLCGCCAVAPGSRVRGGEVETGLRGSDMGTMAPAAGGLSGFSSTESLAASSLLEVPLGVFPSGTGSGGGPRRPGYHGMGCQGTVRTADVGRLALRPDDS